MPNSNLELLRVVKSEDGKQPKVEVRCKLCDKTSLMWRSHYYRGDTPCDCTHWKARYPRLYSIYTNIKTRCYNRNSTSYHRYGGRGITMCNEWVNSFLAFRDWALSNGYSDDLTIERIDVNGNYEPSNCTWITRVEQARNKTNTLRVYDTCLRVLCEANGLKYKLVHQYLKRHPELTAEEVLDYYFKKSKNWRALNDRREEIR